MCARLYLCDGKACDETLKKCCFTQGFECHHTSNIEHSLSHNTKHFPKTIFYNDGFGNEFEKIDNFTYDNR